MESFSRKHPLAVRRFIGADGIQTHCSVVRV
jgi:hypothetical protein